MATHPGLGTLMFIGHFAVGFASKRFAPRASLTVLMFAALWLDLLWPILLLLGIERVRIVPGGPPFRTLDFLSYPWSHSLFMVLIWAALFALVYRARTGYRAGAVAVGIGVVSHWVLDWITHRPDLPLVPVGGPKVGLGLWTAPRAAVLVEVAMFIVGVALYLSATRPKGFWGHLSLGSLLVALTFAYVSDVTGPPPPNVAVLAVVGVLSWVLMLWFVWIDRTRVVRLE